MMTWAGVFYHARQEARPEPAPASPATSAATPEPTPARRDVAKLRAERAKRLAITGRVEPTTVRLYPVRDTIGEILYPPGAVQAREGAGSVKALRLHFVIERLDESQRGTWSVTLTSRDSTWTFDSQEDPEADSFWSPPMRGRSVTVRLYSNVPNLTLRLAIDKRIEYLDPVRQKTHVGEDDTVEIGKATDLRHKAWGGAVARLTFVSDEDGEPRTCTGFLVGPSILLTNDHCPISPEEIRDTIVEFDYDTESARPTPYRLVVPKRRLDELPRDSDLDFALYRLNRPARRAYLKLKDEDKSLLDTRPLVIIQHPSGMPKRVAASSFCYVRVPPSPVLPATDFGHECDTETGSSGAPVQNPDGAVIGLHHYGYGDGDAQKINQAVKAGAILEHIKKANPGIYKILTSH